MRRPAAALSAVLTTVLALLLTGSLTGPVGATPGPGDGGGSPELALARSLAADGAAGPASGDASATAPEPTPEPTLEPTLVLRDLYLARPGLTAGERRAADSMLARPTVPGKDAYASYDPGVPTEQRCGPRVCVTHVGAGKDRATAEWAQQTLATFEDAWTQQVDRLGYRAPAPDGTAGGDARFDVYLANISTQGFYGYCVPEDRVPGEPGRAQSYCVLDNDMTGFARSPQESLAVTAVHEFFHAIQFNLDVREDKWWMEASATWMEEQLVDGVNDNRQFLRAGQLGRPGTPLDTYSTDLGMYGNWIFVQHLSQSLGVDAVRRVWERLDASVGARDEFSVRALERHLRSRRIAWKDFYVRFVEANLFPGRSYDEGRAYRKAPLGDRVRLRRGKPVHRTSVKVPHLAAHTIELRAGKGLSRRSRLHVRVKARKGRAAGPAARLLVVKRNGRTSRLDVRLDRSGAGARTVGLQRNRVRRVVLVLANTSTRYRRCGTSATWACGGRPVDDGQRFRVVVRAVR